MRMFFAAGLFTCLAAGAVFAAPSSVYSDVDLENCPQGQDFGDDPAYEAICPGPDGWELRVMEGDLRFWVEPRRAGTQTEVHFQSLIPFNSINAKAEWRGELKDGVFTPYAMILRYFTDTSVTEETGTGNILVVTKVPAEAGDRSCHVAHVNARKVPNANEVAAELADTLARDFDCDGDQDITLVDGE